MKRRAIQTNTALLGAAMLLISSCGGGGGGGGGGAGQPTFTLPPGVPTRTFTPTPIRSGPSRNERTQSNDAGSLTLRVDEISLIGAEPTGFTIFTRDAAGRPLADQQIQFTTALDVFGLTASDARTGSDGLLSGQIRGLAGGRYVFTVAVGGDSPLAGLSTSLTIIVNAPPALTPTSNGTATAPIATPTVTPTATALPCDDLRTIVLQTDTLAISGQTGGSATITAVAFNADNRPVPSVNILFDADPRLGSFRELVRATDATGVASTVFTVPASTAIGNLTLRASACGQAGVVPIAIVSGNSNRPVTTVVVEADPSTVGNALDSSINVKVSVFDTDNNPMDGINVLFITDIGQVNPLVDTTGVFGSEHGVATTSLRVPAATQAQVFSISALAGGVTGLTNVAVVTGRVPPGGKLPGVPPGKPASIQLSASPSRIQVAGTGGVDLATIQGRVYDNNGQPLAGARIYFSVVPGLSPAGAVILPPTRSETPVPDPQSNCPPGSPFVVSDSAGFALIQLRSGSNPGTVSVRACSDTVSDGVATPLIEQQALVSITAGPVGRVSLTVNASAVDNNDGNQLTILTANIVDAQGNAVEDGTGVTFEIVARRVCSGGDNDGDLCTSNGSCSGGTCTDDLSDPARQAIIANGAVTNGAPPCDVSQFPGQTGIPVVPEPGSAITCLSFPSSLQGSEIVIRASAGGIVNNVAGQAVPLPGFAGDLLANVNPAQIRVSDTSDGLAVIRVTALDSRGAPLQNVRVRFNSSIGSIDRSSLSNASGEASATLTIPAGTSSGNVTVRITGGGLRLDDLTIPIINSGSAVPTSTPGATAQPAGLEFVSASPSSIGVRGSGQPEQSVLTFRVTDSTGMPVQGAIVIFSIAQISGENLSPFQATTDANGLVRTTLTSGQRALPIQVTAQVLSVSPPLVTRSTAVTVVGGAPSVLHFSLAHEFHNIAGRVTFGLQNEVTAFVADRFGNPVPPDTAVSFTTNGGAIGNQQPTNELGQATATLISQAPVPPNGTVATLATTRGERPFIDNNGNGICDAGDTLQAQSEPYYDEDCDGVHGTGENFIDLNSNGVWDVDQGAGRTCADQVVIFQSICSTFSAPTSARLFPSDSGPIPTGGARDYILIVSDNPDPIGNPGSGNPLVGGTQIIVSYDGMRGHIVGDTNVVLPDAFTNNNLDPRFSVFHFSLADAANPMGGAETGTVTVRVISPPSNVSPGGNGSVTLTDIVTFLAVPTVTPTQTQTATVTATATAVATATPIAPALQPTAVILSAGGGAPPNGCTGGAQTFVVSDGTPPFSVFGGGGCVSASTLSGTGASFVYTAGNVPGTYQITITDAAGRVASSGVLVQGPPTATPTFTPIPPATPTFTMEPAPTAAAAFVRIDQILTSVTDNRDGSFTTVLSALVTDQTGAVVADNVPVQFSLVTPVAGASVTSPGFTRQPAPCNIDFTIVLQPGDALSCLKYVGALQGTTVRVRARVLTPTGFVDDERDVLLLDTRATATPTATTTGTDTPAPTATATPTLAPPAIQPGSLFAYAGVMGVPNCNGVNRAFTVTGGAPPFTIHTSGAACLSRNTVDLSGGTFILTTGNQVGAFVVTVTDALGRISTIPLIQQGPPATFIEVDLFADRRVDNGDGSFTSIASALITDAFGSTVPDGVPVEFSLVDPVSGVSVTSPGLTGAPAPCDPGSLQIMPQPGDALSCIKYLSNRQGTTINLRARVTSANGSVIESIRTVTLPDTRPPSPTRTATITQTPTITLTPTPTFTETPFPPGVSTFTPTITATSTIPPTATPTSPPGSIQFNGANPVQLGVRSSGKPEQSVLTYSIRNLQNEPIAGVPVTFALQGTGTEILSPTNAVSNGAGLVTTTLTSGTRATTIRVTASVDTNGDGMSDIFASSVGVSVLGGPPSANRFSIAPQRRNIPGRLQSGLSDPITAFLNDRFGNAVPQGTAVAFVSNASSVVNPSTTDVSGIASATLLSEQVIPPTGIVTVLGFTLGEESFIDNNGNGRYEAGEIILTDNISEPYVDFRPLPPSLAGIGPNDSACTVTPPSPLCNNAFDPNSPFEFFIDTPELNGVVNTQGVSGTLDTDVFLSDQAIVTFSGPLIPPVATPSFITLTPGESRTISIEVHDDLNNPLTSDCRVFVSTNDFGIGFVDVTGSPAVIPDAHSFNQLIDGVTRFNFTLTASSSIPATLPFTVEATVSGLVADGCPNGNGSFLVASGQVVP